MKFKVIIAIAIVSIINAAFANDLTVHYPVVTNTPAFYIRGELGYQLINSPSSGVINTAVFSAGTLAAPIAADTSKSEGLMGRIAVGYGFKYCALESGFAQLNPFYRNYQGFNFNNNGISASLSSQQTKTNLYSIDFLGKLLLPYESYYTFLGGGVVYVHQQFSALNTTLNYVAPGTSLSTQFNLWSGNTSGTICPKFIVGAGYSFSRHWALDASYYYILGKGNINAANFLPDLSAATVNVMYKF
jgi:hypothetical protein